MRFTTAIRWIWLLFGGFWLGVLIWVIAVSGDWFGLFGGMPDLEQLENPRSAVASELYSSDGVLLGKYFRENRSLIEFEHISPNVIDALVATEDVRFEQHSGIDLLSLIRVFYGIVTFDLKGGGSTISQQLAKNLFSTRGARFEGGLAKSMNIFKIAIIKTKEWILAIRIERAYTKKEIITMYLNTVDFGTNAFGLSVAAKKYFNKDSRKLDIPESAVLVGMLKAPTKYNPKLNPEASKARRNTVLEQMLKYNYLGDEDCERFKAKSLVVNEKILEVDDHNSGLAPYFRSVLREDLMDWCKQNGYDLFADGLKIYTTIDSRMQVHAEDAVMEHMPSLQKEFFAHWKGKNPWIDRNFREIEGFLDNACKNSERYKTYEAIYGEKDSLRILKLMEKPVKMKVFTWQDKVSFEKDTLLSPRDSIRYYKHFLHTGMMAMEPSTGFVRAWVGGINFKYFKYDHVKQSKRQPGSTFKPIVYAAAMVEKGYDPCYKVVDVPISIPIASGGSWTAKNSGAYTGQTYTLRQALARSINTVAAYLIREVGVKKVIEYAQRMGIVSPLDPVPSLSLGSSDVSVYELTGAYSTFANKGTWLQPTYLLSIRDKNGKVLQEFVPKDTEVFNENNAYVMLHMLKGATEESGGTAGGLWRYNFRRSGNCDVAAKTGTTSNYSDGWFMGMTKDLVVGVWAGATDRSVHFKDARGQGSHMAMPVFGKFLDKVYEDKEITKAHRYERGKFTEPKDFNKDGRIELDCSKYETDYVDSTEYVRPLVPDEDDPDML